MSGRFPEAESRMFGKVYVCLRCSSNIRSDQRRFRAGNIRCRNCGYTRVRPKSREH